MRSGWGPLLLVALAGPWQARLDDAHGVRELPAAVRTLDTAKTAAGQVRGEARKLPDLGIRWGAPRLRGVEVQGLLPGGPAARAGLLPGDIVEAIGRVRTRDIEDVERAMSLLSLDVEVSARVVRPPLRKQAVIEYGRDEQKGDPGFDFKKSRGLFVVTNVRRGGPAWRAGLREGDTFRRLDNLAVSSSGVARRILQQRARVTVHVDRAGDRLTPSLKPAATAEEPVLDWRGKTFRLAVLCVEFSDVKHNPRFQATDVHRALFSVGEYDQAPDGRSAFGSMRDYWREVSGGQFDIDGTVLDWVATPQPWAHYDEQGMGAGDGSTHTIFKDAIDAVTKKSGASALDGFDGLVFLYAGPRRSERGRQLWPHRSSIPIAGKPRPYYIVEEGGDRFFSIGVHCHEFGHMLGLPDFYGYGHRTGVGRFCTMAIGHLGGGTSGKDRPFHICAWCKIKLGWLNPTTVHPGDEQHLVLRPILGSRPEALKILVSPSGDEYFLLEVRTRTGFDSDFVREGLLIWHVGEDGQRSRGQISVPIDLEEAHGKRYFDASLREEADCLFPSRAGDAFTPLTFPSSASNLASAHEVLLTDMRVLRAADKARDVPAGSVLFRIGDRGRAALVHGTAPEQPVYPDEPVEEIDPVTEKPMRFLVGKDNVAVPMDG